MHHGCCVSEVGADTEPFRMYLCTHTSDVFDISFVDFVCVRPRDDINCAKIEM